MALDTRNNIADINIAISSPRQSKEPRRMASRGDVAAESMRINEETVKKIERMIRDSGESDRLSMHYDRDIDRVVVTISDGTTQQVIRQIPSADLVPFMKSFSQMTGLMINRRL
jgi:uncharacterized FlaG/YvyC family protein